MKKLGFMIIASWLFLFPVGSISAADKAVVPVDVGVVLVASEGMSDPRFQEAVILIIRHGDGGTIGLIINRPSDIPLTHALPMIERLPEGAEFVYFGGPVQFRTAMSLLIRSDTAPPGAVHIFDDVYATSGFNNVGRIVSAAGEKDSVRTFGGYAGWAPGQLDAEIASGGWLVFEAKASAIFAKDPTGVWREYIEESGGSWDWVLLDGFDEAVSDSVRPGIG